MDSHFRSIVKACTWRMGGIVVTTVVAYLVTKEIKTAAAIGAADTIIKLGAYYVHERLWNRIKIGQEKTPEYQI